MSTPNPTGVFQIVESVKSVNKRWENQPRVPISTTKMLPEGQFVDISEYPIGQINIQKLTPNSYWILNNLHAMTLYVGEKECLLIDAPDGLFVDRLLGDIAAITPNPVTALVYTHPHLDHIGGAGELLQGLTSRRIAPRIVASQRFVQESQAYKQPIPQPTEVIPVPRGSFSFDGKDFAVVTPVEWAHTGADSYILFPDTVITFIDFVYSWRLPLHDASGVQNMRGFIDFLRHVMGEN